MFAYILYYTLCTTTAAYTHVHTHNEAWQCRKKAIELYQQHESFQISQIFHEIHPGVQLIDWINRGAPTNEIVLPVIKLLSDWSVLHASTNHMPKIHTSVVDVGYKTAPAAARQSDT